MLKKILFISSFFTGLLLGSPSIAQTQTAPAAPELVRVKVILSEMKFEVEGAEPGTPLTLKAGQRYKLSFENHGSTLHEVLMGRGLVHVGEEIEYKENLLTNVEVVATGSSIIEGQKRIYTVVTNGFVEMELEQGLRLSLLFTVPETAKGQWELGCFAPGHHQSGMFLPINVE